MPEFAVKLREELTGALEQAAQARSGDDADQVLAALHRLTDLMSLLEEVRNTAGDAAKGLVAHGLRLDIDPSEMWGLPYSSTIVREIRRESGVAAVTAGAAAAQAEWTERRGVSRT